MTDEELIDSFVQVFRGRADVYGSAKGFCVHEPLTKAVFERHLRSTDPDKHIGVYCMLNEMCSWGCIDIDGKDFALACVNECAVDHEPCGECNDGYVWDWEHMDHLAINLTILLANAPGGRIPTHIERSKNGYHIWVFPEDPLISAATMRRALMAACTANGYAPKEVNPKAEGPRPGTKGLGNFVRLPYGGALNPNYQPTARYMTDDEGEPLSLSAFLHDGWLQRAPTSNLEAAAALWTPPETHTVDFEAGLEVEPLLTLLDGKSWTIWKDGPLPGSDRSTTLARLAHLLAERGLTSTQAFAVVKSADQRWGGKFANRADGDDQMMRIIENAYG